MHQVATLAQGSAAADINEAHRLAELKVREAIEHAKVAGDLLLKIKAELPHGEFLPWLAANCEVSERQAQRYMRAAQGKPLPLRKMAALPDKSDAASDLSAPVVEVDHAFSPSPLHHMLTVHEAVAYFVEPSTTVGYYFISKVDSDSGGARESWYTARPVRADGVEHLLRYAGLTAPAHAKWHLEKSPPVRVALEHVLTRGAA